MGKKTLKKIAPKHFSKEARKLWYKISGSFTDFDEYGYLVLRTALEAYDRLQAARLIIDEEGVIITTPTGYKKEHPALKIEKEARAGFLSALRLLNLNIEPPGDLGRPPGT